MATRVAVVGGSLATPIKDIKFQTIEIFTVLAEIMSRFRLRSAKIRKACHYHFRRSMRKSRKIIIRRLPRWSGISCDCAKAKPPFTVRRTYRIFPGEAGVGERGRFVVPVKKINEINWIIWHLHTITKNCIRLQERLQQLCSIFGGQNRFWKVRKNE